MAATWEVSIAVVNRAEKRIRVKGTRTDGEDVQTFSAVGQVDTGDLQASLRTVMDSLFDQYTAAADTAAANAALVDGWEATAATYLDGLET